MDERAILLACDQDFFDALVGIADGAVVTKTDLLAAVSWAGPP